jgi:hypothetical protein
MLYIRAKMIASVPSKSPPVGDSDGRARDEKLKKLGVLENQRVKRWTRR